MNFLGWKENLKNNLIMLRIYFFTYITWSVNNFLSNWNTVFLISLET